MESMWVGFKIPLKFNFDSNCTLLPQLLQDELAERSVQLEKVKRAGRDLVSTDESPSLKAVDILCAAGKFTQSVLRSLNHRPL